MPLQKFAFAEMVVDKLDEAIAFHKDVIGLTDLGTVDGARAFSTGLDDTPDVLLRDGGQGLARFAFQARSRDDLDNFERRLKSEGAASRRLSDPLPGIDDALEAPLPSGQFLLAVHSDTRTGYAHPTAPRLSPSRGVAPLDVDHITLRAGDQVAKAVAFLERFFDFRTTDLFEPEPGVAAGAWMRVGDYQHDLAILGGRPGDTLDHLAWTMDGLEHIKRGLDQLAIAGISVEAGPGRHGVGGNLYAYFWTPGGNRYEFSAEMPRAVDDGVPARRWNDFAQAFSAWGAVPPPSFANGSGADTSVS